MALDNIVDLKLNLTATDEATKVVSDLLGVVRDLGAALDDITEQAAGAQDALDQIGTGPAQAVRELQDAVKSLGDTWAEVFAGLPASADAVRGAMADVATSAKGTAQAMTTLGTQSRAALDAVQEGATTAASELSGTLTDAAKAAQDSVAQLGDGATTAMADVKDAVAATAEEIGTALDDAVNTAAEDLQTMSDEGTTALKTMQTQAEQTAAAVRQIGAAADAAGVATRVAGVGGAGAGGAGGGLWGLGEAFKTGGTLLANVQSTIHGLFSGLMQGAMGAWMGGMGLSMLSQSAMGMAGVQSLMQAGGPATTPQQAEQYMALLGMAGVAPTQASSFVSQFSGKLQNMFTVTGRAGLPRQALLAMQAGGFSLANIGAESPINQIASVQGIYAKLLASGQSQAGGQLLSQLGLTQFATLFQGANWANAQHAVSGVGAGLTTAQVSAGAKAGVTLQGSMETLQMTFMNFAAELAPEAQKIVKAVQDIVNTLGGKGGPWQKFVGVFTDIGHSLGGIVETLAGIFVALKVVGAAVKAVSLGSDLARFVAAFFHRRGGGGIGGGIGGGGGGIGGAMGAANCLNICQDSAAQIGTETAGALSGVLGSARSVLPAVGIAAGGALAGGAAVAGLMAVLPQLRQAMSNLTSPVHQLTPGLQQASAAAQQMGAVVPQATVMMRNNVQADVQGMATSTQVSMQQWALQSQQALQQFSIQAQAALTQFTTQAQARLQTWSTAAQMPVAQFASRSEGAVRQAMTTAQGATTTAMDAIQSHVQRSMTAATATVTAMATATKQTLARWQAQAAGDVTAFTNSATLALARFELAAREGLQTWQKGAAGVVNTFAVSTRTVLQTWATEATAIVLGFATSSVQSMIAAQAAIGQAQGQRNSPSGLPWGEWQSQQMQDFMRSMGLPAQSTEPNPWGIGVNPSGTSTAATGGTTAATPTATPTATQTSTPWTRILSTLQRLYSTATGPGMPGGQLGALGVASGGLLGLLGLGGLFGGGALLGGASAMASGFPDTGSLNASQAQDVIQQAIGQVGASTAWGPVMQQLLGAENASMNVAAVNPQAVEYATGAPVATGTPGSYQAQGLFQMMPPTFSQYAAPGEANINNPLDNAVAALRNILTTFRTIPNFYRQTGLGTSSYHGYASGGLLTEPVMGVGANSGESYLFGEAGPEYVTPAGGGIGGGGGVITINVNAPGNAALNRAFAQQIGQQIVQSLKLRGNYFDMANA